MIISSLSHSYQESLEILWQQPEEPQYIMMVKDLHRQALKPLVVSSEDCPAYQKAAYVQQKI